MTLALATAMENFALIGGFVAGVLVGIAIGVACRIVEGTD